MGGGKGGKKVTTGYHYYMNMHFSLAHGGVDELMEIRIGDRSAWKGTLTGGDTALIDQINLFGGEKREGGVLGFVDFMPGEINQPVNPSLAKAITAATGSSNVPAYRGLSTVFFKGFEGSDLETTPWETPKKGTLSSSVGAPSSASYGSFFTYVQSIEPWRKLAKSSFLWAANNPYFKPPHFLVRRVWKGWYSSKAQVGDGANPIHIIYECLTNKVWGRGYPTQDIDNTSFQAAANTLHSEGMGLSLKWSKQARVSEFIEMICEHINGTLVEDRETGKWRIILVRDNYTLDSLFELNESNCVVEAFSRKTLSSTVNEVTVAYTRPEDGETDTVTVQDLANFANTGAINSQKKEYPGITDPQLAFRVALRDLNTLSKPVAKLNIRCNRDILGHYPGDVVKLNWPKLGLNGIPLRIGQMDLGSLINGEVTIEVIEDVFGLPTSAYVAQQPIGWVDPSQNPEPVTEQKVYELTYYDLYTTTESGDRLDWPTDVGFVGVASKAPNADADSVTLHDDNADVDVAEGLFTPQLTLTEQAEVGDTELSVDLAGFDVVTLIEGGRALLGDELVNVTGYNTVTQKVTVSRALIDTVPVIHPPGTKLWFLQDGQSVFDPTERADGEQVKYKLLPETSRGKLEPSQVSQFSYTLNNRQLRPYRPGNVRVNDGSLQTLVSADEAFNLKWSHRDRTQELTPEPTLFSAGNIGPEAGVTYSLEILDEDGTTVEDITGLIGTGFNYSEEQDDLGKSEQAPTGVLETLGGSAAGTSPFNLGGLIGGEFLVMQNAHDPGPTNWTTRFYFGATADNVTDKGEVTGTYAVKPGERFQNVASNGTDVLSFTRSSAASGASFPGGWSFAFVTDIKGVSPTITNYTVPWSSGEPLCVYWDALNSRYACITANKQIRYSTDGLVWSAATNLTLPATTWYKGTGVQVYYNINTYFMLVFQPHPGYQFDAVSCALYMSSDLESWSLCTRTDFDSDLGWQYFRLKDWCVTPSQSYMYLLGEGRRDTEGAPLQTVVLRSANNGVTFTVWYEGNPTGSYSDYDAIETLDYQNVVIAGKGGTAKASGGSSTFYPKYQDGPIRFMVEQGGKLMALQDTSNGSSFDGNGRVVYSTDGITWNYTEIPYVEGDIPDFEVSGAAPRLRRNQELTFRLKAVRDGLDSFQTYDMTVERAGYGYNYGNYYGGAV